MRFSAPEIAKPARRQTLDELRELQRLAASVIMRPLSADFATQTKWIDGRDTDQVISSFIKPNDRLTSFERLEIYNKQYWFRLVDCFYEDFPGLLAILGQEKFSLLSRGYLAKHPSRSFSLRNLGRHLPRFLVEEPKWTKPHQKMAVDMARFEWAQVVAFDERAEPAITTDDLAGKDPARLRLGLQPYVTLLDLAYPLDKFSLALKRQGLRSEASNAMEEESRHNRKSRLRRPQAGRTFVAVHRLNNDLYYKRLKPAAFKILTALRDGKTLVQACESVSGIPPRTINRWFIEWTGLGWFCKQK
jgi:Putative DNA-binding domain